MDAEVTLSCENNWGDKYANNIVYQKQLAEIIRNLLKDKPNARILDLNADTGRLAFELAQSFNDVTALDFTARMIRIPIQLQEQGYMRYTTIDEGEILHFREVVLKDFSLEKGKDNILFMQADAMNLKPNYTGYDLIVMPNLLTELNDPKLFLQNIHERLNENGILVITSDYNWDLQKTPRDKWPGGFKQYGEPVTSLEGITEILSPHFSVEADAQELELVIRKSSRVSEKRQTQLTVWKKKD